MKLLSIIVLAAVATLVTGCDSCNSNSAPAAGAVDAAVDASSDAAVLQPEAAAEAAVAEVVVNPVASAAASSKPVPSVSAPNSVPLPPGVSPLKK